MSRRPPIRPLGKFRTAWEYSHSIERHEGTFHAWTSKHWEDYDAYAVTRQPPTGGPLDFVTPVDSGYYTSLRALSENFPRTVFPPRPTPGKR